MTTVKSYFPSLAPFLGPISRFFEGEATSEVGLQAGWRRDIWTAIAPDIGSLRPRIEEGDKVFTGAKLTPEQRDAFLGQALAGLARSYANNPPPATFRLIVSPMVTWIWIGALIAFLGGLIALWPQPRGARSRASRLRGARRPRSAHPGLSPPWTSCSSSVVLALIVLDSIAPDCGARGRARGGRRGRSSGAKLSREQRDAFARARRLTGLTRSYANDPPPATFRLIVSPMVTWIWIGA